MLYNRWFLLNVSRNHCAIFIAVPELVIATTAKSLDIQPAEAQKVLPDQKCVQPFCSVCTCINLHINISTELA